MSWIEYYKKVNLEARPHLQKALNYFEKQPPKEYQGMDLGCGNGRDSIAMLKNGWQVHAIDSEPQAFEFMKKALETEAFQKESLQKEHLQTEPHLLSALHTQCVSFEAIQWHPVYLVNAQYSLPFCPPEHFPSVWQQLCTALQPDGIFTGNFFGTNDDWKDLLLHSKAEVEALFASFEILEIEETEFDKPSATGPVKHWHIIQVIAKGC